MSIRVEVAEPVDRPALAAVALVAERDNVQNMIRIGFIINRFFLFLNIA
jgi:hypothetical protein